MSTGPTSRSSSGPAAPPPTREPLHLAAARFVVALHGLLTAASTQPPEARRLDRCGASALEATRALAAHTGYPLSVLFAPGATLVAGQPLRAPRWVQDAGGALGEALEAHGGRELVLEREPLGADVHGFALAIASGAADLGPEEPSERRPEAIHVRAVRDEVLARGIELEGIDEATVLARAVAAGTVETRALLQRMWAEGGRPEVPPRMARAAAGLVRASPELVDALLACPRLGVAQAADEADRAVRTALVAVAMARRCSTDASVLGDLALAAMLLDAARPPPRHVSHVDQDAGPTLDVVAEVDDASVIADTATLLVGSAPIQEGTVRRTAIGCEAQALRLAEPDAAPAATRRHPSTLARILATARRFVDSALPPDGSAPPLERVLAEARMRARGEADDDAVRLLLCALGHVPAGCLVELSTREIAIVVPSPPRAASCEAAEVRVRLVRTALGGPSRSSGEITVALHGGGADRRRVVAVLETDPARAAASASETPVPPAPARHSAPPSARPSRPAGSKPPPSRPPALLSNDDLEGILADLESPDATGTKGQKP
jgi:hypothetical protein